MSGVTWLGVAFAYSVLLSWMALRRRDWLSIPWIKPLGLFGFLVLNWFMLQGFRGGSQDAYGTAFFIGGAFGVLSICFAPYVVFLVGETFDRLHRSAAGIDSMRVEKPYDHAEKHESEGNWKAALGLYRDEARRDPKDAEVRRRAGEAALKLGQREESIRWFREASRATAIRRIAASLETTTRCSRSSTRYCRWDCFGEARRWYRATRAISSRLVGPIPNSSLLRIRYIECL